MNSGWAPVAAVADGGETGRDRRAIGFGADELAAVVGGRLLRATERPIRGAAVDSRRVSPGQVRTGAMGC